MASKQILEDIKTHNLDVCLFWEVRRKIELDCNEEVSLEALLSEVEDFRLDHPPYSAREIKALRLSSDYDTYYCENTISVVGDVDKTNTELQHEINQLLALRKQKEALAKTDEQKRDEIDRREYERLKLKFNPNQGG